MFAKITTLWNGAKGWRTLTLSLILATVGVLQTADWATLVGQGAVGPVMLTLGAVLAVLRALTDTPIGTK